MDYNTIIHSHSIDIVSVSMGTQRIYSINVSLIVLISYQVSLMTGLTNGVELCSHKDNATKPESVVDTFRMSDETKVGNVKHNCIISEMRAHIQLNEDQYLPLTQAKSMHVICSDNLASFSINYDCANLHYTMTRKNSNSTMDIKLDAEVWYPDLIGHPIKGFEVFTTRYANRSYQCESELEIPITKKYGYPYLVLSQARIEAFRNNTEPDFNQPTDICKADIYSIWLSLGLLGSAVIVMIIAIDILFCNCCCCKLLLVFTLIRDLCSCIRCLKPC